MSTSATDNGVVVVIPARNAATTIRNCLEAISGLDRGPARVVVLDDHSSDQTAAIARTCGAEVMAVGGEGGLGCARNLGLAECGTRFLAFLNADCYPQPEWLSMLRAALASCDAAVAGGCQVESRHGTWAERWKALHLRQDLGPARLLEPDFLSGGNLLIDTTALRGIRFDDRYRSAYEDVAFCRALRASGATLVYEPAAVVSHDHRETMRSLPRKVWSYGVHSRAVGPVRGLRDAPRAFIRMHRRANDQIRLALLADLRHGRIAYAAIDVYLLCASFAFFVAQGNSAWA